MSRKQLETCIICDGATGRSGKGDDSLYCHICEKGPYCDACYYDNVIACQDDEIAKLNGIIDTVMFDRDLQEEAKAEFKTDRDEARKEIARMKEEVQKARAIALNNQKLRDENSALREKVEKAIGELNKGLDAYKNMGSVWWDHLLRTKKILSGEDTL
jgi:hypothetical protein